MAFLEEIREGLKYYRNEYECELQVREIIRERVKIIDQIGRRIFNLLQTGINTEYRLSTIHVSCTEAELLFYELKTHYRRLSAMVPAHQARKYHYLWRWPLRRNCLQAALLTYLKSESAVTRTQVAEMLGIHTREEDGFHVADHDFQIGLLDIGYELAKLAMNYTVTGNYSNPPKIATFLQRLETRFSDEDYGDPLRGKLDWFRECVAEVCTLCHVLTYNGLDSKESEA